MQKKGPKHRQKKKCQKMPYFSEGHANAVCKALNYKPNKNRTNPLYVYRCGSRHDDKTAWHLTSMMNPIVRNRDWKRR